MKVSGRPPAPGEVLQGLRVRLTAVFFLVALVAFTLFVLALSVRDVEHHARWMDTLLRGEASRAAALIYVDSSGRVTTEALQQDHVGTQASGLFVLEQQGENFVEVFASGRSIDGEWQGFARTCLAAAPEVGAFADIGGERVAGMPWWGDTGDPHPAGCAMALASRAGLLHSHVTLPAMLGSGLLLVLLSAIVWWTAGRSMRVAESALDDRERFLATAAHEMRGPLAGIRLAAELALRSLPPDHPEPARQLRSVLATADRAGRVASNLLLATRIDHAEVPVQALPVRLDELAFEVETAIDGVVVDVTERVEITGDAMLLRLAMTNLADNALRHGRSRGQGADVLLTVARRADHDVVRVADDGPGFPAGLDVTEPYVSGATGGNGLGLPLVRWIARRHGAVLWTGSADGEGGMRGAAVELRFPRDVAQRTSTTERGRARWWRS